MKNRMKMDDSWSAVTMSKFATVTVAAAVCRTSVIKLMTPSKE